MILLAHLLLGAAIGSYIKYPILAIILAFLSHYILDLIPHNEYSISNRKTAVFKVASDFCLGVLLIYIFSDNLLIIYVCAFVALIPDGFTVLEFLLPNKFLRAHSYFHREKLHFLKHKKILAFWRIFSQAIVVIISIIILSI
jgi:hypothetical protein